MIRALRPTDRNELLRMRRALWPDSTESEVDDLIAGRAPRVEVLVAEREEGGLGGFAEFGSRRYAEGCVTSPVAYLEGIWVDPDVRRGGIARSLVEKVRTWARDRDFTELGSDSDLGNEASQAFHAAAGFAEVGRIVCFRASLGPVD